MLGLWWGPPGARIYKAVLRKCLAGRHCLLMYLLLLLTWGPDLIVLACTFICLPVWEILLLTCGLYYGVYLYYGSYCLPLSRILLLTWGRNLFVFLRAFNMFISVNDLTVHLWIGSCFLPIYCMLLFTFALDFVRLLFSCVMYISLNLLLDLTVHLCIISCSWYAFLILCCLSTTHVFACVAHRAAYLCRRRLLLMSRIRPKDAAILLYYWPSRVVQ